MQSLLCATVSDWDVFKDIIIPLVCALFGGLVTFIGIFITIKHENKKSRQEYVDRIRPFVVIESALTTKADIKNKQTWTTAFEILNAEIFQDICKGVI